MTPNRPKITISALIGGLFALAAFAAAPVCAQTYTVTINTVPALGSVSSGITGDTEFRIATSGTVSVVSGTGTRTATASARGAFTIACGNTNACNTVNVNVRITGVSGTGRGLAMNQFTLAGNTGTVVSGPTGTNPTDWVVGPIGKNSNKTFYLGGDFPITGDNSAGATGNATSVFRVWADDVPNTPTAGANGTATALVNRSLSIAKLTDLDFGRVVLPTTGSSTVNIPASTGTRAVSGTAVAVGNPTPTRAGFTVTGEGARIVTITVPASLTLIGDTTNLTVTTSKTSGTTNTLSGATGATGTYTFYIGGSFSITNATDNGAYAATFNVPVNYN